MYLTQTNMFTALTPNAYAVMWSGKLSKPNAIEAKFLKRGQPADAAQRQQHFSLWNNVTAAITSKIRLCQSMNIYLKNNPTKFHHDPIWNDRALGHFWTVLTQQEQEEQQDE